MLKITITKNEDGTFTASYFVPGQGSENSQNYATVEEVSAAIPTLFGNEQIAEEQEAEEEAEENKTDTSAGAAGDASGAGSDGSQVGQPDQQ